MTTNVKCFPKNELLESKMFEIVLSGLVNFFDYFIVMQLGVCV